MVATEECVKIGIDYRRWLAENGDAPARVIAPEPASPEDCRSYRSAKASDTPPADTPADLSPDRWALEFMTRHHDPSESIYYRAMILSAFAQAWPHDPELSAEAWREFAARDKLQTAQVWRDELAEIEDQQDSQFSACASAAWQHDRRTYLERIKHLIRVDCEAASIGLSNASLFELWTWCIDRQSQKHRPAALEVSVKIGEMMENTSPDEP